MTPEKFGRGIFARSLNRTAITYSQILVNAPLELKPNVVMFLSHFELIAL